MNKTYKKLIKRSIKRNYYITLKTNRYSNINFKIKYYTILVNEVFANCSRLVLSCQFQRCL